MDFKYSWVCTACISVTPQPISFSFCIWKEYILELCNAGLILIFLENWRNESSLKKCKISYMDLQYSWACTACISVIPLRTYIGDVQRSLIFGFFFLKIEIFAKTENLWHVTSRLLCLQLCNAPMSHGLLLYSYALMVCLHSTVYHDCAIVARRGLSQFHWHTCFL